MSEENVLMRSIRLQRPDDALYWVSRLRDDGHAAKGLARRLFQCALRDNLRLDLMLKAESVFTVAGTDHKVDLTRLAVELAYSEKLWSSETGRKVVALIGSLQSDFTYRVYSNAELLLRLSTALSTDKHLLQALTIAKELWTRFKKRDDSAFASFIDLMKEKCKGSEVAPAVDLLQRCAAQSWQLSIAEETLFYMVITWAVSGLWGQRVPDHDEAVYGRAATRLQSRESLPPWASAGDRRFEATWDGYSNMAQMFAIHGRMDPADAGVLFISRNGTWFPVIKEESGLYLVQSQSNPRRSYEVNLAILSCTCLDFMRKKRSCKHIAAAREFIGDELPFRVFDDESRCAS